MFLEARTSTTSTIGKEATKEWKKYGKLRPDYDQYTKDLKVIEEAEKKKEIKEKTDALLQAAMRPPKVDKTDEEDQDVTWHQMYDSMLKVYQEKYPDARGPLLRRRQQPPHDDYDEEMKELFRQHQAEN